MNKQRLTVHNPALSVSLLLLAFEEKPSSLGHVYGGQKGDIEGCDVRKCDQCFDAIVTLTLLQEAPIEARDAPGNFVSWLIQRSFQQLYRTLDPKTKTTFILKHSYLFFEKRVFFSFRRPVYIHEISGRFDVGNLASYVECDLYFREKLQNVDSYMV